LGENTGGSETNPAAKITGFLKELGPALSAGDTAKAQGVLSALKDYLAANPPPQPRGARTYSTDGVVAAPYSRSSSALDSLA
jgi:hypothetical protein